MHVWRILMSSVQKNMNTDSELAKYAIGLGDDALIIGQRLAEWCSHGPFLEEDIAISNISLDFIGRASMMYKYACEVEDKGRTEDDIAFTRDAREYTNLMIFELPIGDFAFTMVRQMVLDIFSLAFLEKLQRSNDKQFRAIADKAVKEARYHLRRSTDWVIRLGDGTTESNQRTQAALDEIWGFTHELFEVHASEKSLIEQGIAVDRSSLKDQWNSKINDVLAEAKLTRPIDDWSTNGGRDGLHTEHLGHLLTELQFMQRAYPDMTW